MSDTKYITAQHKAAFASTVCKKCGLCNPSTVNPNFCMFVFEEDETRFLAFLCHMDKLRRSRRKSSSKTNFASFESFCGLFCNSFPPCPQKSSECVSIETRIKCYEYFVAQWGERIPQHVLLQIYELFSGIDLDTVGTKLSFDIRQLKKKERKAIRHAKRRVADGIGEAVAVFVAGKANLVSNKIKVKKKKRKAIETRMFQNDDDTEWAAKIKELLGTKENYEDEADD